MGRISIDDITPGMRLENDLISPNGRFLLERGAVIDEKQLRILKIWNVPAADIQGVSAEEASASAEAAFSPEILARSADYVDALFRFALEDAPKPPCPVADVMEIFRRLCRRGVAERLCTGNAPPLACPQAEYLDVHGHAQDEPEPRPVSPEAMARRECRLASFPDIYFQIMDVLNNPRSSSTHAAEVVSKDTSLTAKLLRVVNSPFYGFPARVDSIQRAVTLVGANELSLLSLGVSVVQYFQDIPPSLIDMKRFWKHSIAVGVFSRILAGLKPGLSEERFFLGGMIHDIGRLIILKNYPQLAGKTFALACSKPCLLFEAEREILGFDHAAAAGALLLAWKLPEGLANMVSLHHAPASPNNRNGVGATILHLADIMARVYSAQSLEAAFVPPLDQEAWSFLDIEPSVLVPAFHQGSRLIEDIYQTFLGQTAPDAEARA
jgi:HD-like signal output (HDOD) protein